MTKDELAQIMPERDLITKAWEMVKTFHDYGPEVTEARNGQLLLEIGTLYNEGKTPAQQALAQGLAHAMMKYFTAKAESE